MGPERERGESDFEKGESDPSSTGDSRTSGDSGTNDVASVAQGMLGLADGDSDSDSDD